MVLHSIHESIHARLARLRQRIIDLPEGPTWLWFIRIRILEFIAAREPAQPVNANGVHRHEDDASPDESPADISGDLTETTLPAEARMAHRWFVTDHPPRSITAMSSMLDEIGEIGEETRTQRGIRPAPELVWEWWRDNWTQGPG